MERSFIETVDGKEALLELAANTDCRQVLISAGNVYTQGLVSRILGANVTDPAKDRSLIVAKAELDGANNMLKFLIQLLDEAARPVGKK